MHIAYRFITLIKRYILINKFVLCLLCSTVKIDAQCFLGISSSTLRVPE